MLSALDQSISASELSGGAPPVVLISGRRPNGACGVWDYTQRLAQALARQGVAVDTYNAADWSPRGIAALLKVIRTPGRIVHLQHPSAAFEGRAFPYFIPLAALGRSPVVTIHEFTRKRKAGKVLAIALFVFARHLIFTTATERDAACRYPAA